MQICAVSPHAMQASASISYANLCRIPSCPEGFSFHFVCKFVPCPLMPCRLQHQFRMQICAVSLHALKASASISYAKLCRTKSCPEGFSFHFVCKFVPYPFMPRGLQLPFRMQMCAVSRHALKASDQDMPGQLPSEPRRIGSGPETSQSRRALL